MEAHLSYAGGQNKYCERCIHLIKFYNKNLITICKKPEKCEEVELPILYQMEVEVTNSSIHVELPLFYFSSGSVVLIICFSSPNLLPNP